MNRAHPSALVLPALASAALATGSPELAMAFGPVEIDVRPLEIPNEPATDFSSDHGGREVHALQT
jgi:hypothetical protein